MFVGLSREQRPLSYSSVRRTLKCAQDLKSECHDSQIDIALSDLKSIAELCFYKHFFEGEFARHVFVVADFGRPSNVPVNAIKRPAEQFQM